MRGGSPPITPTAYAGASVPKNPAAWAREIDATPEKLKKQETYRRSVGRAHLAREPAGLGRVGRLVAGVIAQGFFLWRSRDSESRVRRLPSDGETGGRGGEKYSVHTEQASKRRGGMTQTGEPGAEGGSGDGGGTTRIRLGKRRTRQALPGRKAMQDRNSRARGRTRALDGGGAAEQTSVGGVFERRFGRRSDHQPLLHRGVADLEGARALVLERNCV
jgi:hypothetical protein